MTFWINSLRSGCSAFLNWGVEKSVFISDSYGVENRDWSDFKVIFSTGPDILSFDAGSYIWVFSGSTMVWVVVILFTLRKES